MKGKNQIFPKKTHNAFIGTNLEEDLKARKIETVVIVGVCSDICSIQTIIAFSTLAEKIGIKKIIVPMDCMTTFDDENFSAELKDKVVGEILKHVSLVEVVERQEDIKLENI